MLLARRQFRLACAWVLVLCTLACGGVDDGSSRTRKSGSGEVPIENEPPSGGPSGGSVDYQAQIDACGGSGTGGAGGAGAEFDTLRDGGRLVGVALAAHRLGGSEYATVASREFNLVTPENEMKWDTIEPSPNRFNFQPAESILRFAEQHDMKVKGHTLVWHSQLPAWVSALQGAEEVRAAMRRHIETTVTHFKDAFPGRVIAWDVVNEALDSRDNVVTYRDSIFYTSLGEGFIGEAFHMAHEVDPEALLFYNDYGIESLGAKSQATYTMVRELVEAGVPIDGVGFQMHTTALDQGPERQEFDENITRYIELGLLVAISEMDASLCFGFADPEQALLAQRVRYQQILGTCLQHPECHSVSVWGVGDSDSWLNSYRPCDNSAFQPWPLLFDSEYQKKPAWFGALDALGGCYEW